MISSADRWACDTSVAIAALDPNHEAHSVCRRALVECRPALAGHAAFESHAVLTRLPLPLRLRPEQASDVLARAFPEPCWLDAPAAAELWARLGHLGLSGGATYDALVAAAARADGRKLLTRDRRAERTYRAIEVDYQFVE
jgi:predicted nucleic acid-binding protein